jgi:AcrR family transcriptional regulator
VPSPPPGEPVIAEALVDITLELVDARHGLSGLNMREIARKAGCAHTNVYNYFPSFDGLLLASLKALLRRLIQFTQSQIEPDRAREEGYLETFLAAQIDFAVDHPGWYHFIWFDKVEEVLSDPEIQGIIDFLRTAFNEKVFFHYQGRMERARADEVGDILHGLLHGEICKRVGGRALDIGREAYKAKVLDDCRALVAAFAPTAN